MSMETSKIELVSHGILSRIASGALRVGERLPSIRDEAALTGVSKNTIVEAYLRLVAQGVLRSKPGSGYYVARTPARSAAADGPIIASTDRASLLVEQLERNLPIRPGDGRPPPDWLERSELRRHLQYPRIREADAYNSSRGYLPLRKRLCGALAERGIDCQPDQMIMTHGANHAMDLIIRLYVKSGDTVLVDDPGYYPLFAKLSLAGAKIIGVNRRLDGPDLEDLQMKASSSGARFFFTQSLAHNPTGGSITPGVAYGVLRIAAACDIVIVEDDPFADILPYSAMRLAALDQLDRVIYIGTFSKTLSASFRIGYIATSTERATELNRLKVITSISTSAHDEQLVFELIDQGQYLKHLRRLRSRVSQATAETTDALERVGYQISRPLGGGFYIWLQLPETMLQTHTAESAAEQGIFIAAAPTFSVSDDPMNAMRINVAYGASTQFLRWLGPNSAASTDSRGTSTLP
jgi:DNA-binding transcriptional MocR family regulator